MTDYCRIYQDADLRMWMEVNGKHFQINFHPFTGVRAVVLRKDRSSPVLENNKQWPAEPVE